MSVKNSELIPIVDDLIDFVEQKLGITEESEQKTASIDLSSEKPKKKSSNSVSIKTKNSLMIKQSYHSLFDVAANLSHFSNVESVINKAISAKVNRFFLAGYTLESIFKNMELCKTYSNNLYCGIGIHPYNVDKYEMDSAMNQITKILSNKATNVLDIVAETGLDFSDHFPDPKLQQKWFEKHIEIALKMKKKLYIHERKAHKELIETLERYKFDPSDVLIHCFTGNEEELIKYIEDGYNLSLSGFITKKKNGKEIRSLIHKIPINKLMIESDCPYMMVNDKRMKKLQLLDDKNVNEPVVLPFILEEIVKCYDNENYDMQFVSEQTTKNALAFFGISE